MKMKIFEDIKDMSYFNDYLLEKIAFIWVRYRDGENLAMFKPGADRGNCDNHKYFPDMGERLKESLIWFNKNKWKLNIFVNYDWGTDDMKEVSRNFLVDNNIDLTWTIGAHMIFNSFLNKDGSPGSMAKFLDIIRDNERVVLVANESLFNFSTSMMIPEVVRVPKVDCWLSYDLTLKRCSDLTGRGKKKIFLFCAGMMSEVLIRDLAALYPCNTYMDIGCMFDFIVGLENRSYMTDEYYNKVIKHYGKYLK